MTEKTGKVNSTYKLVTDEARMQVALIGHMFTPKMSKTRVATMLGIHRKTLVDNMNRYPNPQIVYQSWFTATEE